MAALAATVLALGGALGESGRAPAPAAAASPAVAVDPAAATKRLVSSLQRRLRVDGQDADALTRLGFAYEQRARETGDPSYLVKAEGVLRRSLAITPSSADALIGLGSVALSRHDFRRALRLARRARAPYGSAVLGVVGDALVELGRYGEAFRTFDLLAARKPGVAAYARVSYGRELIGHTGAAIEAMQLALAASAGRPEPTAWTSVQLGKLELARGRLDAAARHFRAALHVFPRYPYALDGLAFTEAAHGRLRSAMTLSRQAVAAAPLPQFVGTLADVYELAGDRGAMHEQYRLVGAIERLLRASGVRTDLETAQFDVDHGLRLGDALRLARRAHRDRPTVDADDVLAWALVRTDRCDEALNFSRRALRLGTRDATKLFHRGMIERCLGHDGAAARWFRRALARNPFFSLRWARIAEEYAR